MSKNKITHLVEIAGCQLLSLPDERKIAFQEFGNPAGKPFLLLHGSPGGRVQGVAWEKTATESSARIIAVDRCGFGYSSVNPNGTMLSFAEDMAGVFEALNIRDVTVVGISGGGPFALAIARRFPKIVTGVTLLAGMVTIGPESHHDLSFMPRMLKHGAKHFPRLTSLLMKPMLFMEPDGKTFKRFLDAQPEMDKELMMSDPIFLSVLTGPARDDYLRQGLMPLMEELSQVYRPIDFDLSDIHTPVRLLYGEKDVNVPASVGEVLLQKLPNAELTIVPDAAHFAVCGKPEFMFSNPQMSRTLAG